MTTQVSKAFITLVHPITTSRENTTIEYTFRVLAKEGKGGGPPPLIAQFFFVVVSKTTRML